MGELVSHGFGICRIEVLKTYLFGRGRGEGERRMTCDGSFCFCGCKWGKKSAF